VLRIRIILMWLQVKILMQLRLLPYYEVSQIYLC
jgi:hypothetical protein